MAVTYDVAILGGGMAGSLLARQLRREVPEASVLVVERARERSHKVGESTVDVCGKYLTKRLGLSSYLYQEHLPKNGLRFFFDREDRSGALEELSEIGSTGLVPFPAFQIDRARFEADLLRMNAASGVEVRLGVRAAHVERDGELHTITLVAPRRDGMPPPAAALSSPMSGRGRHAVTPLRSSVALEEDGVASGVVRARWLVDASGRAGVLARARGLREPALPENAAVWGRFRGVADLDDVGTEPFRARVRHTARVLSTNHFCYPGYWIWLIPLGRGLTSVGVVMRGADFSDVLRKEAGFLAFLRSHRAVGELLARAELVDVMSLGQLAYGSRRYFDARERFALVGEAGAFTDPLYSPGGDYIALANDWVTDLVRRDLRGEGALAARAELYDRVLALRLRSTTLLYEGLYGTLGSFDVFAAKWDLDLACYLNLWVEPYVLDLHLDERALRHELELGETTLGILRTMRRAIQGAEAALRSDGRFFAKNLGHTMLDPGIRFSKPDFGTADSHRRAIVRVRDSLQTVWDELEQKRGRPRSSEPIPLSRFASGLLQ